MPQFSSDVFARAMRLVVPMRREFGKNIDVQNFLYDLTYAKEMLDLAVSSQNEKVKENAEYLGQIVFGPYESGLPLVEQRSMVGERFKGPRGVGEAAVAGNPTRIISNANESTEEPRLRMKLMSRCTASVR